MCVEKDLLIGYIINDIYMYVHERSSQHLIENCACEIR